MKFILTENGMQQVGLVKSPVELFNDWVIDPASDKIAEMSKEFFEEVIMGFLLALKDITIDLVGFITLVGGGLCILLKVVGWEDGYKWAGILFVVNVFVKYLLGG